MSSHIQKRKAEDLLEKIETKSLKIEDTIKFQQKINTLCKKWEQLGFPNEIIIFTKAKIQKRGYTEENYTSLCKIGELVDKLNKIGKLNVEQINNLIHLFNQRNI